MTLKQATHPLKGKWPGSETSQGEMLRQQCNGTGGIGLPGKNHGKGACIVAMLKIPKGKFKSHQFPS